MPPDPCVNNFQQNSIILSCSSLKSMSDITTDVGDDIIKNMQNNATDASTNTDIAPSANSISQFLTEIRNYVSRNYKDFLY